MSVYFRKEWIQNKNLSVLSPAHFFPFWEKVIKTDRQSVRNILTLVHPPSVGWGWDSVSLGAAGRIHTESWKLNHCWRTAPAKARPPNARGPRIANVLSRLRILLKGDFLLRWPGSLLTKSAWEVWGMLSSSPSFSDCGQNTSEYKVLLHSFSRWICLFPGIGSCNSCSLILLPETCWEFSKSLVIYCYSSLIS